jgi:hypothetical protein
MTRTRIRQQTAASSVQHACKLSIPQCRDDGRHRLWQHSSRSLCGAPGHDKPLARMLIRAHALQLGSKTYHRHRLPRVCTLAETGPEWNQHMDNNSSTAAAPTFDMVLGCKEARSLAAACAALCDEEGRVGRAGGQERKRERVRMPFCCSRSSFQEHAGTKWRITYCGICGVKAGGQWRTGFGWRTVHCRGGLQHRRGSKGGDAARVGCSS